MHTPFGTRILIGDVRGKGLQALQTVTDLLGLREADIPSMLPLGFGALAARTPTLSTIEPDPGNTLLQHTDGLSEPHNSSGEFYPLTEDLAANPPTDPHELVRHLRTRVQEWTHHLTDDIAIIALTRTTTPQPGEVSTAPDPHQDTAVPAALRAGSPADRGFGGRPGSAGPNREQGQVTDRGEQPITAVRTGCRSPDRGEPSCWCPASAGLRAAGRNGWRLRSVEGAAEGGGGRFLRQHGVELAGAED
ncbi:SpoIIE family protein phosphatase, partial [Kitasatospora sp. NPDC057223]|uniref:SpoIIE family protein phosphatase n=1 Tax=Kitasatospora sp. NPDC057223 TaxID=3346055 RepID=UPI003642A4F4